MPPVLFQNLRKDALRLQNLKHITPLLKPHLRRNLTRHIPQLHEQLIPTTMRRCKKRQSTRRILNRGILWIIMRINERLLDQDAAHAVAEEQDGRIFHAPALDPDGFEEFIGLADEGVLVFAKGRGCVVLVEEDARVGEG